jgi:hypothetical protein
MTWRYYRVSGFSRHYWWRWVASYVWTPHGKRVVREGAGYDMRVIRCVELTREQFRRGLSKQTAMSGRETK